jgi:transposase
VPSNSRRLAKTARDRIGADPIEGGALFVFANKRATRIKVLWFERNGFCLLYKRLDQAVSSCRRLAPDLRRCISTAQRSRSCSPAYREPKRVRRTADPQRKPIDIALAISHAWLP